MYSSTALPNWFDMNLDGYTTPAALYADFFAAYLYF